MWLGWGIWGGDYLRNSVEEFGGEEKRERERERERERGKGKRKKKNKKEKSG